MNFCCSIFSSVASRSSGGIENTTYYLAKEISKYGSVRLFVNRCDDNIEGVKAIYSAKAKNAISLLLRQLKIYKSIRTTDEISLCLSWRYAIVPWLTQSKYIVMCHGNDVVHKKKQTTKEKIESILRKEILRKATHICANSQYTAKLVHRITKDCELSIIHPCSGEFVDYNDSSLAQNYILSIGRLEDRKGFQYVLEAFSTIKDKYDSINYYIAGDGPYKNILEKKISELGLQNRCFLLGRVEEKAKNDLLKNCNILVMPSFFNEESGSVEGFGIVYIEANAHGKPVIGTYSGGIPDAIVNGQTGLLVHEKNVDELIDALDSILSKKVSFDKKVCMDWAAKHYYTEIAKQYCDLIIKYTDSDYEKKSGSDGNH